MSGKRILETDFSKIDGYLDRLLNRIFKDVDRNALSNVGKRKMIYDYLVNNNDYDFELLNQILEPEKRYPVEEIYSILEGMENNGRGIGVCNAFSYTYKLLLEKCGISSVLMICTLEESDVSDLEQAGVKKDKIKKSTDGKYLIDHMFILVQNDDGTFSFDDPTCAILHRKEGINYFNYDENGCRFRNQINIQGFPADFMNAIVGREESPIEDRMLQQKLDSGRLDGLLDLPDNIVIYSENNREGQQNQNR